MPNDALQEFKDAYEYDTQRWEPIRREGKLDMRYVGGDPWDDDDKKARKGRPTVAPVEMGQYFNQAIYPLLANPRGMKFAPVGNGANDKGAEFYQNKAREIEYRSQAKIAYIGAVENAIQRSYGFVSVDVRYNDPRSSNQDLWIEGFPNPDMVLPDTDALRPDSSDMKRCTEFQWVSQAEFKHDHKDAKIRNFSGLGSEFDQFVQGDKILKAKFWRITTKKRQLLLVEMPSPTQPPRMIAPASVRPPQQVQVFKDEVAKLPPGHRVIRELREVDYPEVWWHLTNGLEILDEGQWLGKYIPIVSCYGKTLFAEGTTGMERTILSMTRFGRDPWKSFCYACSQELEVLGMIPKAAMVAIKGQFKGDLLKNLQESVHTPKVLIEYEAQTDATGTEMLPPPFYIEYPAAQHLQALELVKEGFRRSIQAAMDASFLPTQAQRQNEKSGVALDKIQQSASQGTYHYVTAFEGMIEHVGRICEDLMDKVHDYRGETGIIKADGKASSQAINDPNNQDAIATKGDYLVTVSTAPSSDSERDAAADFADTLVTNISMIAEVSGKPAAAKVLAFSVRKRNLGAEGEQLADFIEPPAPPGADGKPVPPAVQQLQGQLQQMQQELQKAQQIIQTDQAKYDAQFKLESMKADKQSALEIKLHEMDDAAKIEAARIVAAKQAADLAAEVTEERIVLALDSIDQSKDRQHEALESAKDRLHQRLLARAARVAAQAQSDQDHQEAMEQGNQGVAGQLAVGQQAADNAPPPTDGATA